MNIFEHYCTEFVQNINSSNMRLSDIKDIVKIRDMCCAFLENPQDIIDDFIEAAE